MLVCVAVYERLAKPSKKTNERAILPTSMKPRMARSRSRRACDRVGKEWVDWTMDVGVIALLERESKRFF